MGSHMISILLNKQPFRLVSIQNFGTDKRTVWQLITENCEVAQLSVKRWDFWTVLMNVWVQYSRPLFTSWINIQRILSIIKFVFCHFYFIQSSLGYCYHAFLAWNKHTHTQMGGRAHPLSCQLLNTFCWSLCGKFKMSCNTNILSKICITHTHKLIHDMNYRSH